MSVVVRVNVSVYVFCVFAARFEYSAYVTFGGSIETRSHGSLSVTFVVVVSVYFVSYTTLLVCVYVKVYVFCVLASKLDHSAYVTSEGETETLDQVSSAPTVVVTNS